jgi:hypothetical protein
MKRSDVKAGNIYLSGGLARLVLSISMNIATPWVRYFDFRRKLEKDCSLTSFAQWGFHEATPLFVDLTACPACKGEVGLKNDEAVVLTCHECQQKRYPYYVGGYYP